MIIKFKGKRKVLNQCIVKNAFIRNIMFNITNKEVIPEIIPHNFINKILSNRSTMVSKQRLINLYKQCNMEYL